MKKGLLIIPLLFFGVGCGVVPETPQVISDPVDPVALISENMYQNTRFGYAFEVPEGDTVYALTEDQTAIEASGDSDIVFLVDGELNFFTVRGVEGVRSAHEWLSQNLTFFYPSGEAGQRIEKIGDGQAIMLTGDGSPDSPARVMLVQKNDQLIVISFEKESIVFDSVIDSFTFAL